MKVYMLHESYSLMDYNDHKMFNSYQEAHQAFNALRESILERERIEQIYTDEPDTLYLQADECSIKIYITEHVVKSVQILTY
jgi:hypothetical protein